MSRSVVPPFLVASTLLLSGCHPPEGGAGTDLPTRDALDRTPAALVEAWVGMWNAYDLDQVAEFFLTDGRLTYFSSEFEGVIRGYDSVLEHHRGFGFVPGGEDRGTRLWLGGLTEDAFGDAAVLTAIWYFQRGERVAVENAGEAVGDQPAGGEATSVPGAAPQRGPVTFVCVLDEGRWRFAHMNFGNYPDQGAAGSG